MALCLYDAAGLVDSYTNTTDGTSDYDYDATGQLVSADHETQADESFNYDANGNRLEYIVGVNNQVLSDGLYWYEYDEEGARTEKYQWDDLDADGLVDDDERFDVTSYTWDARGRLTKITTKPDGQITTRVVQYAYDYLNRRVEKKIDQTAERYTYLGHDIVLQTNKQGDLTHRYLHGPSVDQCLADENVFDDNVLYPLFDNLGSVRDLADHNPSTGETSIVNHILYDAFGRIVLQTDPTQTSIYGHTGRETDAESNLTFHRRRYYDAALGQFISEDPIGFLASDTNLRRYVGNSPTNATDPSGLDWWVDAINRWADVMNGASACGWGMPNPSVPPDPRLSLDAVTAVIPGVSDVRDVVEVATGRDMIWGTPLSRCQWELTFTMMLIPGIASGREARLGVKGVETVMEAGQDAVQAIKRSVSRDVPVPRGFLSRSEIISKADDALAPLAKKFPDARVGVRGSIARGSKGAHKGGGAFDPTNFDVDAFIVSDTLAELVPTNAQGFRNLARLPQHKRLVGEISGNIKAIPGVRQGDTFRVRVFSEAEFRLIVGADEIHFLR